MEKEKILDFIAECKDYISEEIQKQNWNTVLSLVSTAASVLYESNLYYFDEELEDTLGLVARQFFPTPMHHNANTFNRDQCKNNYVGKDNVILYYDGFGLNDRGLVQIYLEALCNSPCKISNKNTVNRHIIYIAPERVKDKIPDIKRILTNAGAELSFLQGKDYIADIARLNQVIQEHQPGHFFFYSTPGDVVGTVILNAYEGLLRRYQINLTDHSFWLGAKYIDVCIEFRDYGASISNEYRKIPKEKIVKIPYYPIVLDTPFQGYPFPKKDGQKVVFSGGSLYKTNGGDGKYYKIVDYILEKHPDAIFWYAGSKGNADSTELEQILKKYPTRAYWTEERKDLLQVLQHSDLYLSTYPMIGGLMTQYAARAGVVPVSLMLDNTLSKGLLLNEDRLNINFNSVDSMIEEIDHLLSDKKYAHERSQAVTQSLISPEVFNRKVGELLGLDYNETLPCSNYNNYNNNSLENRNNGVLHQEDMPVARGNEVNNEVNEVEDALEAFKINYVDHIDTSKFRSVQTGIYSEEKLENAIATRHNVPLVKYFPAKFARGGGAQDSAENEEAYGAYGTHEWAPLYEISFIIATYNSSFERIKKTLVSFLDQEDVHFEIIVADDGSEDNHQEEIEHLFAERGFKDYKMLMHRVNRGTVLNHGDGVATARGKYIKGLAPGDYLYDKRTIRNWLDFLEESGAEWSISDAIYYDKDTGRVVSVKAHPQDMKPYKKHDLERVRWNYVVLGDIAVGVAMLSKAELQKRYSPRIEAKGIKYAEDNMWRLMMFDGIVASYYERPTVYYEYGGGISTSKSKYWSACLRMDWMKADEIMRETEETTVLDNFQKKMLKNMKQNSFWNKILTKGKLMHIIKNRLIPRKTVRG